MALCDKNGEFVAKRVKNSERKILYFNKFL